MGKSTISMVIFNSYVKLPEGTGNLHIFREKPRFFREKPCFYRDKTGFLREKPGFFSGKNHVFSGKNQGFSGKNQGFSGKNQCFFREKPRVLCRFVPFVKDPMRSIHGVEEDLSSPHALCWEDYPAW